MTFERPLITDVSPRDGLQNDPTILDPAVRAELCRRLAATGLQRIETVSFVHPKYVPAMAGAEEVLDALGGEPRIGGALLTGLALNDRGYDRAATTALSHMNVGIAVTESFNERNQGASLQRMTEVVEGLLARAHADGRKMTVTLSVCFGCPFEGRVRPAQTLALVERIAAMGPDEIFLADTIGVAVPRSVTELIGSSLAFGIPIGGHFHDTRGTGIANCLAALEAGATLLDASAGGVGGCPFAPGATGNVATDDLVYVLEESGVDTGINLDALIATSRWLSEQLGHAVPSSVVRAGSWAGGSGSLSPAAAA